MTTSTRDDRVHPGHARKFVKKLTDTGKEKWPVYYYENIEGGHGGKPKEGYNCCVCCPLRLLILDFPSNLGAANAKQSAFMLSLAYDFMFKMLADK